MQDGPEKSGLFFLSENIFLIIFSKIHINIETKILDEGRKFYGNITINLELPVNTSAAADLEQSGRPMGQCAGPIWKCDG